jgi:molybdopterin molybdotransferase
MRDPGSSALLRLDVARQRILAALAGLERQREWLTLDRALDRVLAADIASRVAVPAHDNAAMDGYAFNGRALAGGAGPVRLRVVGRALAGHPHAGCIESGEAVRIMTGAPMPEGTDSVVPVEQVHPVPSASAAAGVAASGSPAATVAFDASALRPGANRRRAGEDIALGAVALRAGTRLRPAQIGLLAAIGETRIPVWQRPRVAVFSSGDELVAPGQPLPPGCIHDSNRQMLLAAAQRLGADPLDLGWVADEPAALGALLARADVQTADLVLTSGGISVGDADHTRRVLAQAGTVEHWQLALRPGRPFVFGRLHGAGTGGGPWIMALPGNPVAALVAFYALVRPALLQLMGTDPAPPPALPATCTEAIAKRPGRTEFPRGVLGGDSNGAWTVRPVEGQGAAMLHGAAEANALIVLDHDRGPVAAGETVPVWAFEGLA